MQLTHKPWAVGLISAALLGGLGVSAQTVTATVSVTDTTTAAPQASPSRSFTTDLAKASLASVTDPASSDYQTQLSAAEASIQAQRDSGMGWGEIAHTMGLNLGAVVSAANRAEPATQNAANANKSADSGQKGQSAAAAGRSGNGGGNSGGKGGGNSGGGNGGGRGK
jgi:uncharacterized membrane protein YgcG